MEIYKNLDLNNLEGEEWRDVEGYNGLYQVSNMGRVKSLNYNRTKQEKILRQGKNKYGYLQLILCKDGKLKGFRVNRLVAMAFIPNPNNFKCVNHKDEDKTNNCVDNLEWCDDKYNTNYGTCIQRRVASIDWKKIAEKLTNRQDLSKQVYQYDKNGVLIKIWKSTRECERSGYRHSAISECCNGKLKSHRGYIWSYTELIC